MANKTAIAMIGGNAWMNDRTSCSESINRLARLCHLTCLDKFCSDRKVIKTHLHKLWLCSPSPKTCDQQYQAGYSHYRNRNDGKRKTWRCVGEEHMFGIPIDSVQQNVDRMDTMKGMVPVQTVSACDKLTRTHQIAHNTGIDN
jgi:hypothetical protein